MEYHANMSQDLHSQYRLERVLNATAQMKKLYNTIIFQMELSKLKRDSKVLLKKYGYFHAPLRNGNKQHIGKQTKMELK